MSLFKKYTCSECSQKVARIARRFDNNKCLCSDCADILLAFGSQAKISYSDYTNIKEYQTSNYTKYQQLFNETHSYRNIHIDAKNLLFYIGDAVHSNTIFWSFDNIKFCEFEYKIPEYAKPLLGTVACDVSIYIQTKSPVIAYKYILHDQAKATFEDIEYYRDWFGDEFCTETHSYDWPRSLQFFLEHFHSACKKANGTLYDSDSGFKRNSFTYISNCRKNDDDDWLSPMSLDKALAILKKPSTERKMHENTVSKSFEEKIPDAVKSSALTADEYAEVMEFLQNQEQ